MAGQKVLGIACAILFAWAGAVAPAAASPRYAAAVIDARTGETLHASNADARLHPASLTKMMTLYMVFEAIQTGRLSLDQRVPVSAHAAGQPPTTVGLRAGQRVAIRDLMRSAAVRSANDSAVVLAEAIGGSESRFGQMMTTRARQIGMKNSTFRNASGLTAPGHLSTAEDMALLGRRLFYDFPQYYNLFSRQQTEAFGRTITNTNRLLGSYRGADGIKTGYTRAAGFNLVASAERGEKRVIAAVFGGRSSASRNAEVARLLDLGFARAPNSARERRPAPPEPLVAQADEPAVSAVEAAIAAADIPLPRPRPGEAPDSGASLVAESLMDLGAAIGPSAAKAAIAPAERADGQRRMTPLRSPTKYAPLTAEAPPPRKAARSKVAGTAKPQKRAEAGDWGVQLGAYAAREDAIARLATVAFGGAPGLSDAGREVHAAGSLYRARLTGLSRETAHAACAALDDSDCLPVRIAR
jgi:D-alanyl-D-alanine carboxypeptidase